MYQRINPLNPLILRSICLDGCDFSNEVTYAYRIFFNVGTELMPVWQENLAHYQYFTGEDTNELRVDRGLFANFSNIDMWKIDLQMYSYFGATSLNGSSYMVFKMNKIPIDGSCYVDVKNGSSLYTFYTVYCQNWRDPDGILLKILIYRNIIYSFKLMKFIFILRFYRVLLFDT
jgi:hypothetical protein